MNNQHTCQHCGSTFLHDKVTGPKPKWCGYNCRNKAAILRNSDRLEPRMCVTCGKEFLRSAKAGRQITCGRQCSTRRCNKINREHRKQRVFNHYGPWCVCCGEDEPAFLTIDHIKGDGAERRRKGESLGSAFYHWIIKHKFPSDLQVLCYNCNLSKRTGAMCHHEKMRQPHPDQLNLFERE